MAWNESLHPRDFRGRFIKVGSFVSTGDGGVQGKVTRVYRVTPHPEPFMSVYDTRTGQASQLQGHQVEVMEPPHRGSSRGETWISRLLSSLGLR